jgi:hypothetical protein
LKSERGTLLSPNSEVRSSKSSFLGSTNPFGLCGKAKLKLDSEPESESELRELNNVGRDGNGKKLIVLYL